MKAISLWQPWASAIALGSKRVETRGRLTHYRGPLAIHAAKRRNVHELIHFAASWNWSGALCGAGFGMHPSRPGKDVNPNGWDVLPFGAVVAVCRLVDCRPAGDFRIEELETPRLPAGEHAHLYAWTERQMGDYTLGRYGWVLDDIRPLATPLPWTGSQGWFEVDDVALEAAGVAS